MLDSLLLNKVIKIHQSYKSYWQKSKLQNTWKICWWRTQPFKIHITKQIHICQKSYLKHLSIFHYMHSGCFTKELTHFRWLKGKKVLQHVFNKRRWLWKWNIEFEASQDKLKVNSLHSKGTQTLHPKINAFPFSPNVPTKMNHGDFCFNFLFFKVFSF